MRILVLTNLFPPHHIGGYERRCQGVVDRLLRQGHLVRVLTGRFQTDAPSRTDPTVTRALHLTYGPPYPPEDLPGMLRCEAADRRTLAAALNDLRPDVVDVWGMEFASQSLVAALINTALPVHLTIEDVWLRDAYARDPLCALARVARELGVPMTPPITELCCLSDAPPTLRHARVRFVSRTLADAYRAAGFAHPRARVRIAGIDLSPLRQMTKPPSPPPFIIVSVGQLTASRGQEDLIAAAAQVAADESAPWPVLVRVIGQGSAAYTERLRKLALRHASNRSRVEFIGQVPADRVADFYASAHLFVFTSHLPEGLPCVLMEAMAAGVPVIATNTGGQRDILDHGRWGPLVPPGNPEFLADAIRAAIVDLPAWQNRARGARQHALENFDIDTYVEAHVQDLTETAAADGASTTSALDAALPSEDGVSAFTHVFGDAAESRAEAFDAACDPEAAWRLAVALKRTGRLNAAGCLLEELYRAHRDDPHHVRRATFHRAELAIVDEDWFHAAEQLQACLTVAPDHRKALFDLECVKQRRLPDHLTGLEPLTKMRLP